MWLYAWLTIGVVEKMGSGYVGQCDCTRQLVTLSEVAIPYISRIRNDHGRCIQKVGEFVPSAQVG